MIRKIRPVLRSIKKTDLVWRLGSNLASTVEYASRGARTISPAEKKIVDDLNRDGIAVTTIDAFFNSAALVNELESATIALIRNKEAEITALRAHADNENSIGSKTFNLECLGSELVFDPISVFARAALSPSLLNIADAYFRMRAKLRYYNVWYTAASTGKARESQLWHFDREDNYILKIFLYLDDVDQGAGPFTYAPETHRKGKYRSIKPEYILEGGVRRTTDEQMAAAYPGEKWRIAAGKKGTIIFADTRGYHKGGEARTRDRLMYTCMYTSPASESKQLISFPPGLDTSFFSRRERLALGLD